MTVLYLILAAIVAALIALYQYGYLFSKNKNKRKPWFALLRFFTIYAILVLFIAPRFSSNTYDTVKPLLLLLSDDSRSINYLESGDALEKDLAAIINDNELSERFEIKKFSFGNDIILSDSLDFDKTETDINNALSQVQELYPDRNASIVIMTDGNQTSGNDYAFAKAEKNKAIYPIIYGDTTRYVDLSVTQLNVNKYSYLNNEFPVEVFVRYQGDESVTKRFSIKQGNQTLFQKSISFSKDQRSQILNFNLTSRSVGVQSMRAVIEPLLEEKNRINNSRNFAVEVIDQQSKILILTTAPHPDIGALKKAMESNKQRKVTIAYDATINDLASYNLVLFYGMNTVFKPLYNQLKTANKNTWLITGPQPDFSIINDYYTAFNIENDTEVDDAQPLLNKGYAPFNLEPFNLDDYPPVQTPYGRTVSESPLDILIAKQIGDVTTQLPLWFTVEENNTRHGILLASGIWRWRAQSYLDNRDFTIFDDLINAQVQYLASAKARDRLDVDYESFYYLNRPITIDAQYLDKNYEFEDNAVLNLSLYNKETKKRTVTPLSLNNGKYVADLSGTAPGNYSFTVSVKGERIKRSGSFSILEYDIEKQFVSAQADKMQQLVGKEKMFYAGETNKIKTALLENALNTPVQTATVSYNSLIDWKWLLGVVLILLSIEWFARKYNGLI